jgi:hypothetical protein
LRGLEEPAHASRVGKFNYDRKKKDTVVYLAGARSLLRPEKIYIQSSVWWVRNHYYDRKKKIQSSVWRVVLMCHFLVLAENWQFFCCGGKVLLRPEKKDTVVCLAGARLRPEKKKRNVLLRPEKKDSVVCLAGACRDCYICISST